MAGRGMALRALAATVALGAIAQGGVAWGAGPQPGTPEYIQRDNQNMQDAYGRQTAPDGQLSQKYIQAGGANVSASYLQQVAEQAANPTRPILDPGQLVPGWNGGNPYRLNWDGTRGQRIRISFTNRYGALLRGDVYAPLPGATDPYTGAELQGPFPAIVITTGSIQGSEKMYEWLAEDLAERGYVVLTYDVQGQGTSETLPHQGPQADFPYCDPSATPAPGEQNGCPGVPFQQTSNFVYGTEDALDFLLSTPDAPYANPAAGSAQVNQFNPFWKLIDRKPDAHSVTPGRTTKVGIIGHSLGAAAVSYVQGIDPRVETVVALDKLSAGANPTFGVNPNPVVPGLGIQSEYGFNVEPYWMMGGSSISPTPQSPSQAPDPKREEKTGFDGWRQKGVDSMVIVPRASTHLEYTDIAYALPASRYGQDVASWYTQAWLDKYLKHDKTADDRLLATKFTYLEPVGDNKWAPVELDRAQRLSFYFCSGFGFHAGAKLVENKDIAGVGGC
ncbi:MAG: alpha/beta hydrolase [Thermoleophilaceae bacterium]